MLNVSDKGSRLAATALSYAAKGWRVFPVKTGGKTPQIRGWREKATTDQLQIARWWKTWPQANIGIATGSTSGVWVLDVDIHKQPGDESLATLEAEHGELPPGVVALTGSGGAHHYFVMPDGVDVRNAQDIRPGLDVRGTGGFIVAPPSVHASGRCYEWEISSTDHLTKAPEWLIRLVQKKVTRDADHLDTAPTFTSKTTDVGNAILQTEARAVTAQTSGRNQHLNRASYTIGRYVGGGEIAREDAETALWSAAMICRQNGWGDQDHEIRATIKSGLDAGIRSPFKSTPRIVIRPDNQADVVERAVQFLADHARDLYQRRGVICAVDQMPQGPVIVDVKRGRLHQRLGKLIQWYKMKPDGDGGVVQVRCDVPKDVSGIIHDLQIYPLRFLDGVVDTPIVLPGGIVHDSPGYEPTTRTVYNPRGLSFPKVAAAPTRTDAVNAYNALCDVLVDFPFSGELDRVTAAAGIMTAVLRPSMGTAPLFLYGGNTPGSGKSLLAKIAMTAANGSESQPTATNGTDEELAKHVTSMMTAGARFLLLDNIGRKSTLGGPTLDALITSERWSQRLLGTNTVFSQPNRVMVLATGNNVRLEGDMLRRVVCCYLDPQSERPDQRDGFTHPDILRHVAKERPRLVHAVLTLLRAYITAGRPSKRPTLGTFYRWSHWVREPLAWVSGLDVVDTQKRLQETADDRLVAWRVFLEAWRGAFAGLHQTASDIARTVTTPTNEHGFAMLESLEKLTSQITGRSLGYVFRTWEGRVVGGLRLKQAGRGRRGTEWRVEKVANV